VIEARQPAVVAVHPDGSLTVGLLGEGPEGPCTVLVRLPSNLDRSKAKVETIIPDTLHAISLDGRGYRHALGSQGHVWTDRNKEWTAMQVGTEDLHGIHCFEDEIFVVGEGGLRLRSDWKEQAHQRYIDGLEADLWALSGPRDNLWAVGDAGTVLLFDGERWGRGEGVPPVDLRVVRVVPRGVWVAGSGGTFWSFEEGQWSDHSFSEQSLDFCGLGAVGGHAFLAAGEDGLCRMGAGGRRWEKWAHPVHALVQGKGRLYLLGGPVLGVHDGQGILQVELALRIGDET
jgi:hypothetical protein